MRQIGTFTDAAEAKRFADYLLTLGITTRVDPTPQGSLVWVHREDRMQEAGAELAAFRENPHDPRYQAVAVTARKIRKEAEERQREHEQKSIDLRNHWASTRSFRRIPVTQSLIGLCILFYFLTGAGQGRLVPIFRFATIHPVVSLDEPVKPGTRIYERTQSNVFDDLRHGEIWRLITPIFLHFGIFHLLFNMGAMIDLGAMFELRRGSVRLLLFVLFAAIVSNAVQYAFEGNPRFGGMSGVIFAIFGYIWMKGLYAPELGLGMTRQTVMFMMFYLFVTMTVKFQHIQIANAAHLSGLIFGIFVGLAPHLVPSVRGPDDGIEADAPRRRLVFFGVLLLALAVRLAIVLPAIGRPPKDSDNYLTLARSLVDGRGFSLVGRLTAYRPPLYPLILAPLVAVFGERTAAPTLLLNVLLGVATAGCTGLTARRWGWSERRSALAGFIVACDPVLAVQARSVMTETLAAFLLSGALMTASRGPAARWALGAGIWLGLASLCRPSLLAAAVLASAAALAFGPGSMRLRMLRCAGVLAGTLIVLVPWAARNARVFGEPVWTTTHGGYTLALANNPTYYRDVLDGQGGEVWTGAGQKAWAEGVLRRTRGLPEPEADRRLSAEGWRMAKIAPGTFARACVARLRRFWAVAPARSVYGRGLRLATAFWSVPLLLALGAGLASRQSWGWPGAAAAAAIFALTIVHAFYWTDLRMRAPVVPAIALVASGAAPGGRKWGGAGGRK